MKTQIQSVQVLRTEPHTFLKTEGVMFPRMRQTKNPLFLEYIQESPFLENGKIGGVLN